MKQLNENTVNNIFSFALCLIGGYLSENNNTINNYDSSYKIMTDNYIKITLKNYYEKMIFYAKLENGFICLYNGKNEILRTTKY